MRASPLAWIRNKLRPAAPQPSIPLTVLPEDLVLAAAPDASAAAEPPPAPGLIEPVVPPYEVGAAELAAELAGSVAGDSIPEWAEGAGGALRFAVTLARVPSVYYAPGFGAVIDGEGRVFRSTIREATFLTPDLAMLPGAEVQAGVTLFTPGVASPRVSASVFMAWGGLTNYGHFLLDCLPGLILFAERGLLERFPPLSPPLAAWHRQLLDLVLEPGEAQVEEVSDPLLHVDDLLFTSCMDHFLHAPNTPLDVVRARILSRAPVADPQASRRLYLTRRDMSKRILVNEAELEAALAARGFTAVQTELMSVADQVALFRGAEAVVAPTGAALANVLFMPAGAKVFEIQPSNYMGIWVRMVSLFVGVRWHGYFTRSPLPPDAAEEAHGVDWMFNWALPLDNFLAHLDALL